MVPWYWSWLQKQIVVKWSEGLFVELYSKHLMRAVIEVKRRGAELLWRMQLEKLLMMTEKE